MSKQESERISMFDRFNASALMLLTSEYKMLEKVRKKNRYPSFPTFNFPESMPMQYETINGVDIRYAHSSAEGKPTLVLLSPFPQSILAYAPIWGHLAKHYNLYAYDMPGFGRSGGSFEFMSFKAQGDFLKVFLEHFQIKNAHLLGPDVGMPAVLYYVAMHENSVKSILVGDGPAINPSSNASSIRKMVNSGFWRSVFRATGSGALIQGCIKVCYTNYHPNEEEISDYIASYRNRMPEAMQWFKDYQKSIDTLDPLLSKIEVPTKIFWGDQDAILYVDNGERLAERMPNSELTVFKDCGHFCYQDKHLEFLEMVISWIANCEGFQVNQNSLSESDKESLHDK
ncbi:alpha/beta fold hydrolase [Vibrio vulnificus]